MSNNRKHSESPQAFSRKRSNRRFPSLGRMVVGFALFAGLSAIGMAFIPVLKPTQAAPVQDGPVLIGQASDFPGELVESKTSDRSAPKRSDADVASKVQAPPDPAQKQASKAAAAASNQPPPAEAQKGTPLRPLGVNGSGTNAPGKPGDSTSSSQAATNNDPFSVAVITDDTSGMRPVADEIVRRLKAAGLDATSTTLDNAGRPDALLMVGQNSDKSVGGWYCDPGPPSGVALSKLLLSSVKGVVSDPGDSTPPTAPASSFPCEAIGAGRAKVAASLVELPASLLKKPDQLMSAADALASGLQRYFTENGTAVRNARGTSRLVWPATGPISSYFGPSHPLGIDIAMNGGNILAATEGTVAFAGGNACCNYGLYIVLDSPAGLRTVYGHLSTLGVSKGQKVRQGQVLGKEGCTGHCTGPHLHFEVIENGKRQDPLKYLP